MSPQKALARIAALHVPDHEYACGATSLGEVVVKHSSGRTGPKVLRCTLLLDHDGDHKDAICCWLFHRFAPDQATQPNPVDQRACSCGTRYTDCETAAILAQVKVREARTPRRRLSGSSHVEGYPMRGTNLSAQDLATQPDD
jgi:hypothetical protein